VERFLQISVGQELCVCALGIHLHLQPFATIKTEIMLTKIR